MDKGLIPLLEKAFRCQVYAVRPKRNVHLLKTDRGHWILKGYKNAEKAKWVTELAQVLREKGFFRTVQYVTDREGAKVFPYADRYYTIMKLIDGKESDHASLQDVKKSAETLAHFHLAARGFPFPYAAFDAPPAVLDKWESRLEYFERICWSIHRNGPQNRLEALILQIEDEVVRDAREFLRLAYKLPLAAEMYAALNNGTLAHRDVASHNFLLTPRGECYLIDLDTVGHDWQLVDLVQLISRMLLMQEYRLESFLEAVDSYSTVNPLSDTQVWMIHQMLRYPDNVMREITGLYGNRPGYHLRGVLQLVQMEARLMRRRSELLRAGERIFLRSPWGKYHFVG